MLKWILTDPTLKDSIEVRYEAKNLVIPLYPYLSRHLLLPTDILPGNCHSTGLPGTLLFSLPHDH